MTTALAFTTLPSLLMSQLHGLSRKTLVFMYRAHLYPSPEHDRPVAQKACIHFDVL